MAEGGLWMRRNDVKPERLIEYALRLGNGAVIRRLGYLLELYKIARRENCSPAPLTQRDIRVARPYVASRGRVPFRLATTREPVARRIRRYPEDLT